ncbi:MAG: glutaredoxin family protein [Thermoanaerobaculia bacterium]
MPKTQTPTSYLPLAFLALILVLALMATAADWTSRGPSAGTASADSESDDSRAESGEVPEIILYQTSWCGYCRKARQLLEDLDAVYVAKDIERDREAAREYQDKGRGYSGIPLIDFDGQLLRGYDEGAIRRMVREQKERAGASA